jgi:hypothetical protein
MLLERSWWAGLNGNLFGKIWIHWCGRHWFLSDYCHWKFNKFQKKNQVLEGKISWKCGHTCRSLWEIFGWQQPIVWVVVFLIIMCLLFWPRKAEGSRFERSALVFGSVIWIGTFFFWYFSQFGCLMLSALIFVLCLHGFYFFEFCFAKEV